MGQDPEEKGCGGQWEGPKFNPQVDDMMWKPGDPEDHNHCQDRLSRLWEGTVSVGTRHKGDDAGEDGCGYRRKRISFLFLKPNEPFSFLFL